MALPHARPPPHAPGAAPAPRPARRGAPGAAVRRPPTTLYRLTRGLVNHPEAATDRVLQRPRPDRHRAHAGPLRRALDPDVHVRPAVAAGRRRAGCTSTPRPRSPSARWSWLYLFRNQSFYFVRNMFLVAFGIALIGYIVYPDRAAAVLPRVGLLRLGLGLHRRRRRTASRSTRCSTRTPPCRRCTSRFALMIGCRWRGSCSWRRAEGLLGAVPADRHVRDRRHGEPLHRRRRARRGRPPASARSPRAGSPARARACGTFQPARPSACREPPPQRPDGRTPPPAPPRPAARVHARGRSGRPSAASCTATG